MKYNEFKNKAQILPIVFSRDFTAHVKDKQAMRNQLKRWHRKKLLIKLRRGVFLLNTADRKIASSRTYVAAALYGPSYVSMEYALGYYNLIPERVNDITSVTAKKTLRIKNDMGTFIYQHIKPAAFSGFIGIKDEAGLMFFIAEPEKALVDFCYLNLEKFRENYELIFEKSYRLQNTETLDTKKIINFAGLFENSKLTRVAGSLCSFIKKEKGH